MDVEFKYLFRNKFFRPCNVQSSESGLQDLDFTSNGSALRFCSEAMRFPGEVAELYVGHQLAPTIC